MGKQKKTRKFAVAKKIISSKDIRIKENQEKEKKKVAIEKKKSEEAPRHIEKVPTAMFFQYNTQLGPPYHILVDTNFINFSIKVGPPFASLFCISAPAIARNASPAARP